MYTFIILCISMYVCILSVRKHNIYVIIMLLSNEPSPSCDVTKIMQMLLLQHLNLLHTYVRTIYAVESFGELVYRMFLA